MGITDMAEGIVYILVNEAMPGLAKIGKTSAGIEDRIRSLDTTGVPLPFECFHASKVSDIDFVETHLHDAFGDFRVRRRREFFRISPERVQAALLLAQIKDVTPLDDVVEDADDKAALDESRTWQPPFSFHMVDIPVGAILQFVKDPEITCSVSGNKKIQFEDRETSLSSAARTILHRMGYTWKQVPGPRYWLYEGESLSERRRRMEEEDD